MAESLRLAPGPHGWTSRYLPGITDLDDPRSEKCSKRLARLRGVRKYVYHMDILERALSCDEVTEIFVRVNSLGAKLRSSDLALAQITAKWRGALKTFQTFQEQCAKACFDLDLAIHLKAKERGPGRRSARFASNSAVVNV